MGQGECGSTKHAPDSEPDKCDTGRRQPYAAARTDLCGGREVTRVPTAKGGEID